MPAAIKTRNEKIIVLYGIAAVFNWYIPNTGVDHRMVNRNPLFQVLFMSATGETKARWPDRVFA